MRFEVLKEFTWAGQNLVRGDLVEISDESPKIGALARSKFIRHVGDGLPGKVELPKVEQVAQEIKAEEKPVVRSPNPKDAKEIVRLAKAKAAAKK